MVDTDRNAVDSYTCEKYGRIITHFKKQLTHPERTQETEPGDLFADILRDSLGFDIMLLGSDSIRLEKLGPIVQYADLMETFPYDDLVFMIKVTGAQLKRMVLHILRDEAFGGHTEFYRFSHGVKIIYDRKEKKLQEFSFEGQMIDDAKLYSVGLQKFHFANLKDFEEAGANAKARVLSTSCRDVLDEYLSANQQLFRKVEGRLTVI